jgi:hypothetical protein
MDLRKAVRTLVIETGLPSVGQGAPFILTQNWVRVAKGKPCKLDFEILVPAIIFDRNSEVCFHKGMVGQGFTKVRRARERARAVRIING